MQIGPRSKICHSGIVNMSITAKRILFAIGLLIVWIGFVLNAGILSQVVMGFIAGWAVGGWIYMAAAKVFPD
jgi:fructose-specific phosphotransferase system IIC component